MTPSNWNYYERETDMQQLTKEQKAFLYLLMCALHKQKPDEEVILGVDYRKLYEMTKRQSLAAMVYYPLSEVEAWQKEDPALAAKWKEKKEKSVRKELMFQLESDAICRMLDENEIWHLPLKGYVLKDFYPEIGMREMADQDILFDPSKQEKLKELMIGRGYEVSIYKKWNHDTYQKSPFYNYEMHVAIFPATFEVNWQEYYGNIRDRLQEEKERPYHLHFTREDFYIHMILHGYKHYSAAGNGLRALVDLWIYRHAYPDLSSQRINTELVKLGGKVAEYETVAYSLAQKLFNEVSNDIDANAEGLSNEDAEMLGWLFSSGTYGTFEQRVQKDLKSIQKEKNSVLGGKISYIWGRLFPNLKWVSMHAPFVYEHKILLPGFYVYRLIYKGIKNRKKLWREWKKLTE